MAREDMHALRHRHHNAKKHAGVVEAKGETNVEKIGSGEHSSYPPKTTATAIDPVWSSGVPFYPPSKKFWRIGNEWYDFTKFADKHPGGANALFLSRDRFEDATFVFEAHHHNFAKARKIIQKYKIEAPFVLNRPRSSVNRRFHSDADLFQGSSPNLLPDNAFYSVLRRRVADYLIQVQCPTGDPTWFCIGLFWFTLFVWCLSSSAVYHTGSFALALWSGFVSAWLGAFGHNFVHQPKYKSLGWAQLSLDMVGFSSQAWFREHNLQHHMYTNTPWDNHFCGSEPFLITDPTVSRNWLQTIFAYATPILFCFALYVNYFVNTMLMIRGQETFVIGKLILPLHFGLLISKWGLVHGFCLLFVTHCVLGNYYFPLALMNHNTEKTWQIERRNQSEDWGIAQLHSCADWSCDLRFWQAGLYLWLNFHTVHHLFPRIDFSHHPAIYKILVKTCKEFNVEYNVSTPGQVYKEMIQSFQKPRANLGAEILVYAGGGI